MNKIYIILGSSREGRLGETVSKWVYSIASQRDDMEVEVIDPRDWPLPFFNDPNLPMMDKYGDNSKKWAEKIAQADGFVIVTPEYNHGYSAVLKNMLDHIYKEWNNKPVAFVSYGGAAAGTRAVEQLRGVVIELQMMPIRSEFNIAGIWTAFDEEGNPVDKSSDKRMTGVLDDLSKWTETLKVVREKS